jgi:hypothetical protein
MFVLLGMSTSKAMTPDPESPTPSVPQQPVTPPHNAPRAPVQIYPPRGINEPEENLTVTSSGIRDLREEVLAELEADNANKQLLNLTGRLALVGLLGVSLAVIFYIYHLQAVSKIIVLEAPPPAPLPAPAAGGAPAQPLPAGPETKIPPAQPTPAPDAQASSQVVELELLALLAKEDAAFDVTAARAKIAEPLQSGDTALKTAAGNVLKAIQDRLDAAARATARDAAGVSQELTATERFPEAFEVIERAMKALPADAPWSAAGREQLGLLLKKIQDEQSARLAAAFDLLEENLRRQQPEAVERVTKLLKHPDPKFRQSAEKMFAAVNEELARKLAEERRIAAAARAAWSDFFQKINTAALAGELDGAARLCAPPKDSALLTGGVADPQGVLQSCGAELAGLRALQDLLLEKAAKIDKTAGKPADLPLRKGRVSGALAGTDGRKLQVTLTGGAVVSVKIETLTAAAYASLLTPAELEPKSLQPFLEALAAHENVSAAEAKLRRYYEAAKQPLPPHWAEFFTLQAFNQNALVLETKLKGLQKALADNQADIVRDLLQAVRPELATHLKTSALSPEQQKIVDEAERVAGRLNRMQIVLQNGSTPKPDYTGQVSDQISEYKDSINKTDVGVQFGLKLGAAGGVQRALLRFEGLESAIGKARVRKAMLELYQIDSPASKDAVIGFFRLKRAWVPDSGTWLSYDAAKNLNWAQPGATGAADIEAKEDALLKLDDKKNIWRSVDVTSYVQDVLVGKIQNNGFLLRVINGEPQFHARFYPETDTTALTDKTLRPKLVLELEQEVEPPAQK